MAADPHAPPARLMLQGTGSDVGKSLLVAGLCRLFANRGLAVRPFKAQNMSNNAAVSADGGEIGRAQALQAQAARVPPSIHMNPVLLKPESDTGSRVVVQGQVTGLARAAEYHRMKPALLTKVLESYRLIAADADLVVAEGAGSAAEINLRAADIANMGFAEAADLPVVLVADIDRGGVIAQIVGTWEILSSSDRGRLVGYIINKFRGDQSLFTPALDLIHQRTGLPCFGVVPFWPGYARLPAEDSASLHAGGMAKDGQPIRIAVPMLSRIANFDDFDPLAAEPDVELIMVPPGQPLPGDAHLVILPGSKSTIADLEFVRAQGWDIDLAAHRRRGGHVLGICAGYQMLGTRIADPLGVDGKAGAETLGLGLLTVETVMGETKILRQTTGRTADGHTVQGYEMHMGRTHGPDTARAWLTLDDRTDGAASADGRVMGCYLHGVFASDAWRGAYLGRFRPGRAALSHWAAQVDAALDDLAQHLERSLDIEALWGMATGWEPTRPSG